MGITHGQQDRPEEEIAGYARLADLYADRPEAAVAEQVAKGLAEQVATKRSGLVNMGITHGRQDRPDEAIAAFARLADLYAERPEAAIAEQVAMGLVYMGITHGRRHGRTARTKRSRPSRGWSICTRSARRRRLRNGSPGAS